MPALDATLFALADPTRRAIVDRLVTGEATVGELAAPFDMSLPSVSRHIRVLEDAGLLRRTKEGRVHRCRLDPEPMRVAASWLASHYREFWEHQLDRLESYVAGTEDRPR